MYRLDENCYSNAAGTASHRLTLGHSAVITTYSDDQCSKVVSTTTVEQRAIGWSQSGNCLDDISVFYGGDTRPNVTAVAIYDDSTCSGVPSQIKFSQDFACQAPSSGACQDEGSSHHSISDCTSDISSFAAEKFGATSPYVIMQEFPNPWCYSMEYSTAYSADGLCHSNADDGASFIATINADSTATITMFSDSACTIEANKTNLDSGVLSSSACVQQSCSISMYGCGRRYAVGGLGAVSTAYGRVAVTHYKDDSCISAPIEVDISKTLVCEPTSVMCDPVLAGTIGVYKAQACIDDYMKFADLCFGFSPYLIIESYVMDTNCKVQDKIRIYVGDGKCHPSAIDGNYFSVSQRADGSVVIVTYPTSSCVDADAVSIVKSWYINTGACFDGNKVYRTSTAPLATSTLTEEPPTTPTSPTPTWTSTPTTSPPFCIPPPATPAPTTWTPPPTTQEPLEDLLEIMFPAWLWDPTPPRVFVDDGFPRHPHHKVPNHGRFP